LNVETIIATVLAVIGAVQAYLTSYYRNKSNIEQEINEFINQAEVKGIIGEEKLANATEMFYSKVPNIFKIFLTKEKIAVIIDRMFKGAAAFAKKQLEKK